MPRLTDALKRYKQNVQEKVPPPVIQAMHDATLVLKEKKFQKMALKVGDYIDSFTMLDAKNQMFHLDTVLDKHHYIVLSFYRGSWCPYCNLELQYLKKIVPQLKILNTQLYAITPQTPDLSNAQIDAEDLGFNILCDKNNALARKFGIVFSLNEELRPIYESFGIDILQSNKNGTFDLPLPATFIINSNHEVIYAYVEEDYTKRCEPEEIVEAIKKDLKNRH